MQPEQSENSIQDVIASNTEFGKEICSSLATQAKQAGMDDEMAANISFDLLEFTLSRDPFSQKDTLEGRWYGPNKNLIGSILFHAEGSFFAEYDVVQPHPRKKGWFVEAVSAWGNQDSIKSEARLLPMPE